MRSISHQPSRTAAAARKTRQRLADMNHSAARVSSTIEEGNVRGAVRLAASNDTLASHDDDTLEALRQLQPPRAGLSSFR